MKRYSSLLTLCFLSISSLLNAGFDPQNLAHEKETKIARKLQKLVISKARTKDKALLAALQAQADAINKLSINLEDLDSITQYRNAKTLSSNRRQELQLPTTKERVTSLLKSSNRKKEILSNLLSVKIFGEASFQQKTLIKAKTYLDQLCDIEEGNDEVIALEYLILEPTLNLILELMQRTMIFNLIHKGLKTKEFLREPEHEFLNDDLWPFVEGALKGGGLVNVGDEDRKVIFQNENGDVERTFLRFWLFPKDSFFSAIQMGKEGFSECLIREGRKGQNAQKFRDVFKELIKAAIQNSPGLIENQSIEHVGEQKFVEYITSLKNTDFSLFEAAEAFSLMIHQPITIWALSPDQKRAFPLDISMAKRFFKEGGLDEAPVANGGLHLGLYNGSLQLLLEEDIPAIDIKVAVNIEKRSVEKVQSQKMGCNFPVSLILTQSEHMKIRQQMPALFQDINQPLVQTSVASVHQSLEADEKK